MPMYMKWGAGPDIKGEVTESKHKDWIAIDTISLGSTRSTGIQVGSGQENRHRDQPQISDVTMTRTYDAASPQLFNASVAGEVTNVWIEFLEPATAADKEPNIYLKIALRDAMFSAYNMSGGGRGPQETIAISYSAINFDYTPYDEKDKAGSPVRGFFDLITAKCVAWK